MESIAGGVKKTLGMVIGGAVIILCVGNAFISMWPQVTVISGNVTAMTGTDLGTTTMKWVFPLVLLVFGLALGIALIMWAINQI
jgi:hypothetical protein